MLFTRDPELPAVLTDIVAFPAALKDERRVRFVAQLLAWRWDGRQGVEKADPYLTTMARARVALRDTEVSWLAGPPAVDDL